ncbi:hypothetical protein [Arcobacter aquimarinus]|uniref:Uncharacterized protein n=1 Tax=Arcobacter aquimarinus TaxID=1315211 RepID=A0AAE7B355_9BACT|nr:hypothetical protein [Arcobacter aquimarinus]QKE26161.1 hypothetical protein AAQM_1414 [Arcobacter aquimarinus]RXI35838.1 hypothetical protein CP986_05505 [Arcobacter aquimarinus]
MNFTNIPILEFKMDKQSVLIAFFTIRYGECNIECVYSKAMRKFLFAIVDRNIGFTCSLNGTYANTYINHKEALNALAQCRNHGRWDPTHFYEVLNNSLPDVNISEVTTTKYRAVSGFAVSNFEDRIYFNHWRKGNISDRQTGKTIELLGYEVLRFCQNTGVTPVYFPYPTDRTMAVMNDFKLDYEQNNSHN